MPDSHQRTEANNSNQPVRPQPQTEGDLGVDTDQMFRLIDSVLFFEACLYHQVLPLALEENRLMLGMVNPEDTAALDYIRSLLSHMKCSLVPQRMAGDDHQALLSAYLSYKEKSKPAVVRRQPLHQLPAETVKVNLHDQPNLILTNTGGGGGGALKQGPEEEDKRGRGKEQGKRSVNTTKVVLQPNNTLMVLDVQAKHLSSSSELLATLPAQDLLPELLGRVLTGGGIGRLYLERQAPDLQRVLWSRDGVLQSVLEQLPVAVFQEVINDLKQLALLPLTPVQAKTLVELDCLYQKTRLLLRLQLMPGEHGEQATLQVLRGAALKFYQRQQLTSLSRDGLAITRQLLRKVNELQKRVQGNFPSAVAPVKSSQIDVPSEVTPAAAPSWLNESLDTEPLELPPDINELLENLDLMNESVQAATNLYESDENTD
ncbi:MAG: hypothetical protein JOZ78_16300 [Chroococcidiopsidaceae cyanobacterium CP_BM_ER_R8_30]|nr:hypothetical protein [Chroococcidiopsidaceae cyanobacterium CP_BM_ER_R8_30]